MVWHIKEPKMCFYLKISWKNKIFFLICFMSLHRTHLQSSSVKMFRKQLVTPSIFTLHKYMYFFFKNYVSQKMHFLQPICQLPIYISPSFNWVTFSLLSIIVLFLLFNFSSPMIIFMLFVGLTLRSVHYYQYNKIIRNKMSENVPNRRWSRVSFASCKK